MLRQETEGHIPCRLSFPKAVKEQGTPPKKRKP